MESRVCLVIDLGSGDIKAGVAGEDMPKAILPTIFGTPKYGDTLEGCVNRESFCGDLAD